MTQGPNRFKAMDPAGDGFKAMLRTVTRRMAAATRDAGGSQPAVLESVGGLVRTALRRTQDAGGDFIMGTKAIVMGVIWGAGEKEGAALEILSHAARTVVRQTAVMNGDMGAAVTGLLRGAIAGADRMGVPLTRAAHSVTSTAIEEVYRIGSDKVQVALKENILGMGLAPSDRRRKAGGPSGRAKGRGPCAACLLSLHREEPAGRKKGGDPCESSSEPVSSSWGCS